MKPLNLDNSPCSPTSSNCVIWQGPDLACIKLCKGDTVSDVVAKLATELCTILDQLNVNNYDLTCFNSSACPPVDFQALIQFLINHICALEGVTPNTNPSTSPCPDCVVSIAPCFIIGTQTTMQLTDYVQMIGERVCDLITTIDGLQIQIDNIDNRVYVLENAPKETFTLPSITVACTLSPTVLGGSAYPIDTVLNALVNDPTNGYCSLIDATGLGADLFSAVSSQCITSTTPTLSNYPVPFGTEYLGTWVATPTTVADAITNLWIVVCDMYDFLSNIDNVVVAAGEGISVASTTVSNVTTYTVTNNYLETFVANLTIEDVYAPRSGVIPLVSPASVSGIPDGQTISEYTQVSSNSQAVRAANLSWVPNGSLPTFTFGSFDNATGIFTVTDPGTYLIKATIHLKPNNSSSIFWSGPAATFSATPTATELQNAFSDIGSFYIGITPDNTSDVYIADSQTLTPGLDRCVELSTSKVITTASTLKFKVKVLNTTNRSYNGTGYVYSDGISFSIIKLRTNLTITQL
jgi:hypothetical protein